MGKLTALHIKHAKAGERLSDGEELRLEIDAKGRGRWFFRYTSPVTRRERLAGFGPLREVSLADARELLSAARSQIRRGVDPLETKRIEREAAKVEARRDVTFIPRARFGLLFCATATWFTLPLGSEMALPLWTTMSGSQPGRVQRRAKQGFDAA